MRLLIILSVLWLTACSTPFRPVADYYCDPLAGPRDGTVYELDASEDVVLEVGPGWERYDCLPARGRSYTTDFFRVIGSVRMLNLKKGDVVQFQFENQFSNKEVYEISLVTSVVLAEGPDDWSGFQVADMVGDNILGRDTQHHSVRSRHGFFEVMEDVDEVYLNYFAYAASGHGQNGAGVGDTGVDIDVGYGQIDVIVWRNK